MADFENFPTDVQEIDLPAAPTNVMTVTAEVENKPQELRKLRPYLSAMKQVPPTLTPESQIVLHALFSCFEKQKNVQEGLIRDIAWGLAQGGVPTECTVVGMQELIRLGYVKMQAPDGSFIDFNHSDKVEDAWIRYQQKLLDMVYDVTN